MVGILCEKPSAARNFAKALGGQRGTYNGEQFVIVAARGHLYEFVDPEKQVSAALSAQYKSWDLKNLPWDEKDFAWKRAPKKDTADVIKTIKTVLSTCDEVCIATDVDPTGEGELLAWEVLDEANIRARKYSRMYFTDEAPKSIQKAFVQRKPLKSMMADMDYVKALYRSQWDYMSMQFTRIATKHGDGRAVLRQGRLKSAMVYIVGDQLLAIKNYKKVPFYQNRFKDENGNLFTNPNEPTYPDKKQVPQTYRDSRVVIDSRDMKSKAPPRLLDLATMSSILAGQGYKAKDVLAVYQKMYESQVVSYPRTEDKCITPEQFDELLPLVDKIAAVVGVNPALLTHRSPRKTHVKTGGAHGANRPGTNVPADLDSLKQYGTCAPLIYDLLARNYLAMLAEDYEYEAQKGHLELYPEFTGFANIPKKMGYKAISTDGDDDDDEVGKGLGTVAKPFTHEGFPPKPTAPTMKWLMKQLEKHDVGTGATRTSIYAEVTNEKAKFPLLIEKRGKLTMSEFGDMSFLLLKDTHIGNLKITEQLMQDMRDIAAGKADPAVCLHRMQQLVIDDMVTMERNGCNMRKELGISMSGNAGKSSGQIVQKEKVTGKWKRKEVTISREWSGHRFTDEELEKLFKGEEIEIHGLVSKSTGKTYGVRGKLTNQEFNGRKFVGFERTGFANANTGVPDVWCQHKFTDDEKILLEQGKSVEIDGCVSKKGSVFSCKVHYGKNDRGQMGIIPEFN